jgi:DNA-binding NtrC family response regulator
MNTNTHILVIDDDEVVRRSLRRTLADEYQHIELAWNGETGLRAMNQQPYDVVLLDLRMPGMDGVAVLEQIKQHWPETEVIIITGYPAVETAKQAIRLGAYDYLAKPVGPDEVIHAAQGALQHKRWALRSEQVA